MLASSTLLAAAPAGAQTSEPGKRDFDARAGAPARPATPSDAGALAARDRLNAQLGRQGVLDIDPRTGTPRWIGKLDGFLTGPSGDDPADVVLTYVRAQRGVFGLSEEDITALRLVKRYTDVDGITHLIWAQTWRGISAWDNELRASVAANGSLINVGGSTVPGLASRTPKPELDASQALSEALGDVGRRGLAPRPTPRGGPDRRTTFTGGHSARLVLFTERRGDVRLAWNVIDDVRPGERYEHLVDARSGDVLVRHSLIDSVTTGTVFAFDSTPNDAQAARTVPFDDGVNDLRGPFAFVYPDADADGDPGTPDATTPRTGGSASDPIWNYPFVDFTADPDCTASRCSWDPGTPFSWQTNQEQNATQVYYFVNRFHDWLNQEVGFAGFEGVDRVRAEVVDGAATGGGVGDGAHSNNAFMATEPEGTSPTMGMFVWDNGANGGDDATVVFHEYTHGLSNRLIIRPNGYGALDFPQAGAMGEGWSDWYAMDYLVQNGLETDDPAVEGELAVGEYVTDSPTGVRDEAIDCGGIDTPTVCSHPREGYDDFVGSSVHDDGEIWGQTLWAMRQALVGTDPVNGGRTARRIITQAMRLAPDDPTFLDMRNAIIQADRALNGGANRQDIWTVFAGRGMGFLAFSDGPADTSPTADTTDAPDPNGGAALTGRVTDAATGAPIANALVEIPQLPGDYSARTDANGNYAMRGLRAAAYPRLVVSAPGYELAVKSLTVPAGGIRVDQPLRRNLAAASGGATIVPGFSGPDFTSDGCGPSHLIDGSRRAGWGSTSPANVDAPGEKQVTIQLPAASDVTAFRIDPAAICGDDDSASLGAFRAETSTDGQTFTPAVAGTFDASDNRRMNGFGTNRSGVRFVRFVMTAPQSAGPGEDGQVFLDATEFEVIGAPPAPPPPPPRRPEPPVPDLTAPVAKLALVAGQRLRSALRRGMRITVSCDEPCSGVFIATLDAKTAKKAKLLSRRSRRKSLKIASGRIARGPGRRSVRLKFGPRPKARLKTRRSLRLTVAGTVTDAAGNDRRVRRIVRLRR